MSTTPLSSQDSEENKENASKDEKAELPAEVKKILTAVPENKREELESAINRIISFQVSRKVSTTHYSGPFPPPEILKGYEEVLPGSAEKILEQVTEQGNHRRAMEKKVISSQQKQSGTGQWLGFIVAIIGLGGSFYLVATGHDIAGGAIAGIDLIGLVSVFVIGKRSQQKELNSKKDKS